MLHPALMIAPGAAYWQTAARALQEALPLLLPDSFAGLRPSRPTGASLVDRARGGVDLSGIRVVVPTFFHAQQLRGALAAQLACDFVAPRITTLQAWLAQQAPADGPSGGATPGTGNERLMALYAELRQHAWLKKLFAARRNTDLLPLAQTLLALADELTAALWPVMQAQPVDAETRWEMALARLPASARSVLSEEAQLVWSIWKSQLDADDPTVHLFARMMALADTARTPLVWFAPVQPDACTQAFLHSWARRQPVLPVLFDWRVQALAPALAQAWPEIIDTDGVLPAAPVQPDLFAVPVTTVPAQLRADRLTLGPAGSLEEEAQCGAQTIIDWLQQGRSEIAIVAQDRVVARRIRALLQRAGIAVADETGWKLSTTRAASAVAAWFDVVASRAESKVLLDFLKSPFLLDGAGERAEDNADQVMTIELALRRANVTGGWHAVMAAVPGGPARERLQRLAAQAAAFRERRTIAGWLALTTDTLDALGIGAAFAQDAAGMQVGVLLSAIGEACALLPQEFSFAEWRSYVALQLEATAFLPPVSDRRVIMLPLNGTHLRSFDAVLVVGADAAHLPSVASETLFFANAVRHELGLPTRESRQLQQLRDFAELISASSTVVLSWQAHRDGEPSPVSNWMTRLDLVLVRSGAAGLALHRTQLATRALLSAVSVMPAPGAPELLPQKLSASGFASLSACPYQFFATRMLGLSGIDELSDQLGKRDYGDWLHRILDLYHAGVRDRAIALAQRPAFLQEVTDQVFAAELAKSAAALGYLDRWQKAQAAYLAWANAREADGWHFVTGEAWRQQPLRWSAGEILLHGRIDRIDRNDAGEVAVLDYKTSSPGTLKKRIEGNEDHQLAFYGLLADTAPAAAGYVALEPVKGKISEIAAPDFAVRLEQLQERIGSTMQAIATGASLRASGIESVCQYCEVRGLCRKGAW